MLNKRKGITLVALVVTIILLLILAAVTIALLIGPNGAITKAKQSKIASKYAQITDLKDVWEANNKTSVKLKEHPGKLTDFTLELLEKNVINSDEKDEIDTTKKLELEYGYVIHFNEESLIKVGDIVYYNPTVGVSDPNLLTYTSPKGSSKADGATDNSPGNGWQAQTFTATSDDCKWVVLYKRNGKIVLMSEDLKNPSENAYNGRFGMYEATGYLYAEQELHNICSIYGHGKGAANNAEYLVEPKIGSPDIEGDLINATITNPSGARSIMMEDIELVANIQTKEDKIEATKNYRGEIDNWYLNYFFPYFLNEAKPLPTTNIKMPTLTQGVVDNKPLYTYYEIGKADPNIPDNLKTHIFKNNYWITGRCVNIGSSNSTTFCVRYIHSWLVFGIDLCFGDSGSFTGWGFGASVRPIVVLDSEFQLTEYTKN